MTTPRTHYRVDVLPHWEGATNYFALIRTHPGLFPDVWCPHTVRATSRLSAQRKAVVAHRTHCEGDKDEADIASRYVIRADGSWACPPRVGALAPQQTARPDGHRRCNYGLDPSKVSPEGDVPSQTHDERMDAHRQTLNGAAAWLAWETDLNMTRGTNVDNEPYPVGHPLHEEG